MRFWLYIACSLLLLSTPAWCLSPPDVVRATAGNEVIELNWSAVPDTADYDVYRAIGSPSGFTLLGTAVSTSYRDTGVSAGKIYYYYIVSHAGSTYSSPSQTVNATPVTTGTLVYNRWNDFVYYFNPWMMHTNGDPSDTHTEQELYLTEGDESVAYSGSSIDFSYASTPQLTPDRQWLVFSQNDSLRRVSLQTKKVSIIVPSGIEPEKGFSVSPDGQWVVYVKKVNNHDAIYRCTIEGADEQALMQDLKTHQYPSYTPDGNSIVFVSNRLSFKYEIYTLNLTTSTITRITNNSRTERYPRMSPDGTAVVYQAYNSSTATTEIFSISTDGSSDTCLTDGTSNDEYFPAWSPDSSQIAYILRNDVVLDEGTSSERTEYYFHIQVMNADGSGTAQYLSRSSYKIIRGGLSWIGKTDVMSPSAITDLEVVSVSSTGVEVSFSAPGDDGSDGQASSYAVVYAKQSFDQSDYDTHTIRSLTVSPATAGTLETVSIDHLLADTDYYIAVIAYDELGNVSLLSNMVTATTDVSGSATAPTAPTQVSVEAHDYLSMNLSWTHSVSSDTAGYNVYRNGDQIAQLAYVTSYIDTVPQKSVTYTYTVSAYDETNTEGAVSSSGQASSQDDTVPPAPEWIRIYNSDDAVRIQCEPLGIPDVAGYKIYRDNVYIGTAGTTGVYDDTSATSETTSQYRVSTMDTAGNESALSDSYAGIKGWPDNKRTLVLYTTQSTVSQEVATYYQNARNIPAENVLGLDVPVNYYISLQNYLDLIRTPVLNYLENNNLTDKIIFVVLTKDMPVFVEQVAVDALLADVYRDPPETISDYFVTISDISTSPHDYYLSKKRFSSDYDMIITSRIDAPTVDLAKSLVDQALFVERHPSFIEQNIMWIDNRGDTPYLWNGLYSQAERFIATSALEMHLAGISYQQDTKSSLFSLNSCTDTQFYYGWYSYHNFQDVFSGYLMPGSVAGHLDSASFYNIRNTGDNNWGVHLLERGATVVYGATVEPYTAAFPVGGIMYSRFFRGFTIGEAYWCAANNLGWRLMLVGDPLYNPYESQDIADTTDPVISDVASSPLGYLSYVVTWSTDELTEHAVQLYDGTELVYDSGYLGWFSRSAHVSITNLTENTLYTFYVKSRDLMGNESVSTSYQLMYTDTDYDGIEDNWEITYFGSINAVSGNEDSDGDNLITFYEFDQGLDPLTANVFTLETDASDTTLSFDGATNRTYQIYYSDELTGQTSQWTKAGPYRYGMTSSIEWDDNGVNTSTDPQDESITTRIYRITHTPISR